MIEIYATHKTLNKKKIFIILAISVCLIICCIVFLGQSHEVQPEVSDLSEKFNTFTDNTNHIQIELSDKYKLEKSVPDSVHILSLSSKNNLHIFLSCKTIDFDEPLVDIADREKESYANNYDSVSNLTNIKSENINNIEFYSYSFNFFKDARNYIFDSIWFKMNSDIYIFDIVFPNNQIEEFVSLHSEILNSLKVLN